MILTEAIQRRINVIGGFYGALKKQEADLEAEVKQLKEEVEILTKASVVIKHLLNIMVKDEISKMADLITYGLKTIFEDQSLVFLPKILKKNEKIHIELKTVSNGLEGEFSSFGGSVAVIESYLLRLLCLLKKKMAKLMLLDETFAAIGDEYIANTSKLINQLSKKLGIDTLLLTHNKDFLNYADNVYRVKESPNGLIIEKIK